MESKVLQLTITAQFGGIENTVYPTLLCDSEDIVLIDCGFIGSLPMLEAQLEQHGLSVRDLTGLVLTHHDHDHMGAAAALKRANPNVLIYSSFEEAPFISARDVPLRLRQAEEMQKTLPPAQREFGEAFCAMLRRVEPVEVDRFLRDGDCLNWCGGCRVIATPGHTPGHLSLLVEKGKIIITGDAIALAENHPVVANPQFALDLEQAEKSFKMLLSMKADVYYCYHGGTYPPAD